MKEHAVFFSFFFWGPLHCMYVVREGEHRTSFPFVNDAKCMGSVPNSTTLVCVCGLLEMLMRFWIMGVLCELPVECNISLVLLGCYNNGSGGRDGKYSCYFLLHVRPLQTVRALTLACCMTLKSSRHTHSVSIRL